MRWTILQECFQSFETLRFLCNLFSKSLIHDFLLNRNAMCVFFQVPKTRAFSLCLCYSVNSTKMYNKLPNKFLKCYFDSKCLLKHTKMFEQNQAYQIFPVSSVLCLSYQRS